MSTDTGITTVHQKGCKVGSGGRCNCTPAYRAEAYDHVARRRCYKTFPAKKAARAWRQDMQVAIRTGKARVLEVVTLADVFEDWHNAAGRGVALNRGGQRYKPSVLRAYKGSWDTQIGRALGRAKVGEVRMSHVQDLVDSMVTQGLSGSTIRNTVTALRVLYRWAIRKELATIDPCVGVAVPANDSAGRSIVPPETALRMVQELFTPREMALWSTAFFAGLRRGELAGLRWSDVDLVERTIVVRQSWDPIARVMVLPKSKAGSRELGFPALLVPFLALLDGVGDDLVFGRVDDNGKTHTGLDGEQHPGRPFDEKVVMKDATYAWECASLPRLTLHECRHTYASVMIAAGVNIKTIQTWMGHSSVTVTLDLYGHLLPGSAAEALGLLDAFLERETA